MFKRFVLAFSILAMLFVATGCSAQNQENLQTWNTLFFGDAIEVKNLPEEYKDGGLDRINQFLGENCPLRKDIEVDGQNNEYTLCRDFDGEAVEVKTSDILMLGAVGLTSVNGIPGDELLAVKWAWNSTKTAKIILAVVFTEEVVRTGIKVVYTKTSNPLHDPHQSQAARNFIKQLKEDIKIRLSDPEGKIGPFVYCAVVVFQDGVTYVRVLSSSDNTTGTMSWFGKDGWVHAFDGKDVFGFLNGKPRGALSYDTGRPLKDCLNALGKIPSATKFAP